MESNSKLLYLYERRKAVESLLAGRQRLTPEEQGVLADRFSCEKACIYNDIKYVTTRKNWAETYQIYIGLVDKDDSVRVGTDQLAPVRARIIKRDQGVCQYCGNMPIGSDRVLEHVIPSSSDGTDMEHNLVLACRACNTRKKDDVWIPRNILVLQTLNREWAKRIIKRAKEGHENLKYLEMSLTEYVRLMAERRKPVFKSKILSFLEEEARIRGNGTTIQSLLDELATADIERKDAAYV